MDFLEPMSTAGTNGQSTVHDLFALTDEQILEIEPQEEVTSGPGRIGAGESPVVSREAPAKGDGSVPPTELGDVTRSAARTETAAQSSITNHQSPVTSHETEPPQWVAEAMNDPQRGGEVRAFWEGTQKAQQEAAAYREVFAKPEEARTAAERARLLDDIDRAYFAGDTNQRAQLAAVMLREDPAAFREMVFAGLRALEAANVTTPGAGQSSTPVLTGNAAHRPSQDSSTAGRNVSGAPLGMTQQTGEHLAAYAAFEKTANQELEQSVGGAIARALVQALPQTGKNDSGALKERLGATIRQEIEKALQGDRQLGEQVAQILAARRLDDVSRSQVVRLIGERAKQLVPGAAKRVLQDWTQTTLATHRAGAQRSDAATARREVAPASSPAGLPRGQENRERQRDAGATRPRPVDYRKLSDEQILDL